MLKQQLGDDLKAAMLSGDTLKVSVLRSLKSAITYAEVAKGAVNHAIDDEAILELFRKEAKKRQESADLYIKGGRQERADKELREKQIIETYLPAGLNETDIAELIDKAINEVGALEQRTMGQVIAKVKELAQGRADGAVIARLVRERLPK